MSASSTDCADDTDSNQAQAAIPVILSKERRYRGYHHDTYNIARIYALAGKGEEAVKWLRTTVKEGSNETR
jgi:hypothetical protein